MAGPSGNLNPGVTRAGQAIGAAMQSNSSPISGSGGNKMVVDSSDVATLHSRLQSVIADIGKLDSAVESLVGNLKKASDHMGNLTSGKGGTGSTGGRGLSASGFSSPGTTPSPAGGTTTPAAVGFMNKAASVLTFGAAGATMARFGGAINGAMAQYAASGMAQNMQSTQAQAIFGQPTGYGGSAYASQQYNKINAFSQADRAGAISTIQGNSFLFQRPGSRGANNVTGFMNAAQGLNPLMSAAGAAQFANTLTSGGAMQTMMRYGGMGAGLFNNKGGINKPGTVMADLFRTVMQGRTGSAAQMRQASKDSGLWAGVAQNFGQGTQMNLTPAEIESIRQYAASGGNLKAAEKSMGQTGAMHALKAASQISGAKQSAYQGSLPMTNAENDLKAAMAGFTKNLLDANPALATFATALGQIVGHSMGAGSALSSIGEGIAVTSMGKTALKGLKGLGKNIFKGGRGAVEDAAKVGGDVGKIGGDVGEIGGKLGGAGGAALGALALPGAVHNVIRAAQGKRVGSNPLHLPAYGKDINQWIGHDSWSWMGDPPTGSTSTAGMQPAMKKRVSAMMAANPNLKISSGHRTSQQQAYLYAAKGGRGVARPGQSAHQSGKAADLGPPSQFGWIAKNASKFGLGRPAPKSEPWHVQVMGDPPSGGGGGSGAAGAISAATTAEGTPYVWGGTTPGKGFDCSGLVQWAYKQAGVTLPRTSEQMASSGTAVNGIASAQPGDIIIYNGPDGPNSHVALYIGNGKQIEAAHTGTVVTVNPVDTPEISTIRRVAGAGNGSVAASAAGNAVGKPSTDSSKHATSAVGTTMNNSFLGQVSSLGGMSGGGGGGIVAGAAPGAAPTSGGSGGSSGTSSTGNTAVVGGGSGPISNPTAFSKAVLAGLGISPTVTDVTNINAWQQHEGQWTVPGGSNPYYAPNMHDPLNTNLPMPGGHALNGTWSYPDWKTGVAATVSTIKQSNMAAILTSLKANDNIGAFTKALEGTPWASSAYGGQAFATPSGVYAMGDPVGSMSSSGAMAGVSGGKSMSGAKITVNMPLQVIGVSQQDAQRVAQMVMAELRSQSGIDAVSGG